MECLAEDNIGEPCVYGYLLYHQFCGWTRLNIPCTFVCTSYPTYSCTMIPCILLAPTWPLIPLFDSSCCASLCLACTRRRVESRGQVQSNGFQVQGHRDTGFGFVVCLVLGRGPFPPPSRIHNVPSVRFCMYITGIRCPTML